MTYLYISHHLLHRAVKVYISSLYITLSDSPSCHINTWLPRCAVMLSRGSTSSKYGTKNIGERPNSLKARCMILFLWCLSYWCLVQQWVQANVSACLVLILLREQAEFGSWTTVDSCCFITDCSLSSSICLAVFSSALCGDQPQWEILKKIKAC